MKPATGVRAGSACLVLLSLLLAGCKKDDMAAQPRFEPYEPSTFFQDGTSARPLVPGVVPRDPKQVVGVTYGAVLDDGAAAIPVEASGSIPFPVTREVIQRGQNRFNIYCAVCHGRLGNGNGMIVQRGFTQPPSFHIKRLLDEPDSKFFNVISNGYNAMYSYRDRIAPADRWCIVAYVRALQAAGKDATPDDHKLLIGRGEAAR